MVLGQEREGAHLSEDVASALCEGRYRLTRVLGLGGMATVYLANDSRLGVYRAIKVLSPQLTRSKAIRRRFLSEAQTMARLHHPHIVTIHDVGVDGDRVFMVMELLEGGNLMDLVKQRGPLSSGQALEIVRAVLSTLELAHGQQVIHRDIKPANILLGRDSTPKLTDFGIARVHDRSALTTTGSMLGTFGYMAPEQRADASKVDARADLYAVAASLYTLLSGWEPVDLHATEVKARGFDDIPADIAQFIRRGTSYNPAARWDSARAMSDDLQALQGVHPPERVVPLDFASDGLLPGLDLQDIESDILPEFVPPKTNLANARTPRAESQPPSLRTSGVRTSSTESERPAPRPPWMDFVAGLVISALVASLGWLLWYLFVQRH